MQIKGKNGIVIGGAQGIGHAYCRALLKKGAKLYMGDIQEEKGKQTVHEFQTEFGADSAHFVKVDVTNDDDIKGIFQEAIEALGQLDIVVGNAGIIDEFDFQKCIDVNLSGTIRVTNEALKYMGKDNGGNGGVMVHTASICGLRPEPWGPVYAATKHAMIGYCRSWACEKNYKFHGIRINCICPTSVPTAFRDHLVKSYHSEENYKYLETVDNLKFTDLEDALTELIEDESYNGLAMRVTKALGRDVAIFQDTPLQ